MEFQSLRWVIQPSLPLQLRRPAPNTVVRPRPNVPPNHSRNCRATNPPRPPPNGPLNLDPSATQRAV
eukprot:6641890-Lingulodinium_polyedra.AAC.1